MDCIVHFLKSQSFAWKLPKPPQALPGNPMTSIATLGGNFVQSALDEHLGDPSKNLRGDDDHQWMIAERERMWYTGVKIDPKETAEQKGYARPDVGVQDASQWTGISRYITERSVIDGKVFVTSFNTGHGMKYYQNGSVSNNEEWANINLQDILPTWQWWIDTEGTKLQVDFDYGDAVEHGDKFSYQAIGGYEGGSSLVVNGTLDARNSLRLYKTDLEVTPTTNASITYNKISANDHSNIQLGLIFEDAPDRIEYVDIPNSGEKTDGYITKNVSLSTYANRDIAAMTLEFDPDGETIPNYQVNFGELAITDGADNKPNMPEGFKVEQHFNTDEVNVVWDRENYGQVIQYKLYAQMDNGQEQFLGGVYGDSFYIKTLDHDVNALKLTAVGMDHTESDPAIIELNREHDLSSVKVEPTDQGFDINWSQAIHASEIRYELSFTDGRTDQYTNTVDKNLGFHKLEVPVKDGDRYLLKISAVQSDGTVTDSTSFAGKMKDVYAKPYDGSYVIDGNRLAFDVPSSKDWWHMYIEIDGQPLKPTKAYGTGTDYFIRGYHDLNGLKLPSKGALIRITLEDYSGNKSTAREIIFGQPKVKTITSVDSLPDMTVTNGTYAELLKLPEVVHVQFGDGTAGQTSVTWNTYGYDPNTLGKYTLDGTLGESEDVMNVHNLKATMNVIVKASNPDSNIPSDNHNENNNTSTNTSNSSNTSNTSVSNGGNSQADHNKVTKVLPDGSTSITVTDQKTGNSQVTITSLDGTVVKMNVTKAGMITAEIQRPAGVAKGVVSIPIPSTSMNTVAVLIHADGTEEVIKDSIVHRGILYLSVDGNVSIKVVDRSRAFMDIQSEAWYSDAVNFVSSHDIFLGTDTTTFSPQGSMTRGMLVTVLQRLANGTTKNDEQYVDVSPDQYFANAVAWASEQHIAQGMGDGRFAPHALVTREQLAVMMYQLAGANPTMDSVKRYMDDDQVSAWAADAMNWAVNKGLMIGKADDTIDPSGIVTRAEVAQMILRYCLLKTQ